MRLGKDGREGRPFSRDELIHLFQRIFLMMDGTILLNLEPNAYKTRTIPSHPAFGLEPNAR
jgi:hypothetical protein